jgi:hypothetical protein
MDRLLATCPAAKLAGTPLAARDVVAGADK